MPENMIQEKINMLKEEARGKIPEIALVREIAYNFAVSEAVARVRLKQLRIK